MSYQQPPGQNSSTPPGPPPGWYPDPGGIQVLCWWGGIGWSPHTRPMPATGNRPGLPYPGTPAGGMEGYGTSGQATTGRHRLPGAPQDAATYQPGPVSGPYAASARTAPQQDQYQPQAPEGPAQSPGWPPQQQDYAPGPQAQVLPSPRRRRKHKGRYALIGAGTLIAIIVAVSVATAHNLPSAAKVAATSTASAAAAPAPAASTAPDCTSQVVSWRNNGGLNQLEAVMTDMGNVGTASTDLGADLSAGADASQDEAALQTAAASLQSDSETAQANLPPSCVPNLRTDEGAALNDASTAALNCENAISELGSGDFTVALGDMNAANTAISASSTKFQAATADVQAFDNGS